MNSQYMMIGVVCIVAFICYYIWNEVKKTQVDITGLKTFSGNVANYIEANSRPATIAVTPVEPVEDEVSEEKKED